MSNSVTVPSDSTLSLTVTCKTFPSAISLVGWFQAAWNLFVSIPTYPANAESPDPLPSAFPGPDPPPPRKCGPGSVEACPCNCLPLFLPAAAGGRLGSGEALGFSFFSDFTEVDFGFGEASLFAFPLFSSSSFSFCFSFVFSFTLSSFFGEDFGVAEWAGDDLGVAFGVGLGDGLGVALGVGLGVALGVGLGVGFGVGLADGLGVGSTVGRGVGVAAGVKVVLGVEIGSSDCWVIGGGVAGTGAGVACSS